MDSTKAQLRNLQNADDNMVKIIDHSGRPPGMESLIHAINRLTRAVITIAINLAEIDTTLDKHAPS